MVRDSNAKLYYMSSECKLHFISQFCDVELNINKLFKMTSDFILKKLYSNEICRTAFDMLNLLCDGIY